MNPNNFKKIINNEDGIAIGLVLTAIVILTTLMINFTFDSNVNKIKSYNIEDRARAKLTAEAGLQFAMARLRLYKESYNYIQNNKAAKDLVKQETLNLLWSFPFAYPIPTTKDMNAIQKDSIAKFLEETSLDGTLQLNIQNISNKMNLNLLRLSVMAEANKNEEDEPSTEDKEKYSPESQLFKSLQAEIDRKLENDDEFSAQYSGIDTSVLVNELKYYISDPDSIDNAGQAESNFTQNEIIPKFAPITSLQEIYTLPSWSDDLVKLVQNEFTVHGAVMIDLNKITERLLKILVPGISEDEIKEFFEFKDNEKDPKFFNTLDDFKNYIVNVGNVMNSGQFDDQFAKYKAQGLNFGPAPTLFRIKSSSSVGRASITLDAYVTMPAQPEPRPVEEATENPDDNNTTETPRNNEEDESTRTNTNSSTSNNTTEEADKKTLLLEPRIIEIIIN